jgi:hypothetical protein
MALDKAVGILLKMKREAENPDEKAMNRVTVCRSSPYQRQGLLKLRTRL